MDRGKRSAIQARDFLGCFISATIGTANTFRCGPWPCTGICGRAGRCGPTKFGSTSLRPGVIEPIVEQPAGVIRWRRGNPSQKSAVNPIAIFAATRWEVQAVRRGLATDRVATIAGVRCHIGQQGDRTYWLIQTGVGPDCCRHCCGKDIKSTDHVVGDVHGVCLRARTGSGGRSYRRHSGVLCAW